MWSLWPSRAPEVHALTFMIRGIRGGWKQSLTYVLLKNGIKAEILSKLLNEAIQKLSDTGVCIKVIVM